MKALFSALRGQGHKKVVRESGAVYATEKSQRPHITLVPACGVYMEQCQLR